MNFDLAVPEFIAIEKDTKMAKYRLAVALLAVALGLLTTGALSQQLNISIFTSKVLKQVVALHHFYNS